MFGESRLVLLVSLIRASVLNFMFCIVYVWLVDDSFPCYIIGNVIWVIENSLVNLYAGLYGWGLFYTSLVCLRNMMLCKLWVRGGRGGMTVAFSVCDPFKTPRGIRDVQFCHPNLTLLKERSLLLCDRRKIVYISSSSLHKI
jgi:hypothetical protein